MFSESSGGFYSICLLLPQGTYSMHKSNAYYSFISTCLSPTVQGTCTYKFSTCTKPMVATICIST